uniref:Ig-like domain-containing protein n=1 Tax=Esox lucius TaxID=8010 RepID=A0A3P8ZNG3_ESOLU
MHIIYFIYFVLIILGDSVTQPKEEVTVTEGGQITLTCRYETDYSSPYLFWYQQRANDYPKYMLRRFKAGTGDNATEFKDRFHAHLNITTKSVPLRIQSLQLSDSAVYYCGLTIINKMFILKTFFKNPLQAMTTKRWVSFFVMLCQAFTAAVFSCCLFSCHSALSLVIFSK